jgi:hypothetical protein
MSNGLTITIQFGETMSEFRSTEIIGNWQNLSQTETFQALARHVPVALDQQMQIIIRVVPHAPSSAGALVPVAPSGQQQELPALFTPDCSHLVGTKYIAATLDGEPVDTTVYSWNALYQLIMSRYLRANRLQGMPGLQRLKKLHLYGIREFGDRRPKDVYLDPGRIFVYPIGVRDICRGLTILCNELTCRLEVTAQHPDDANHRRGAFGVRRELLLKS